MNCIDLAAEVKALGERAEAGEQDCAAGVLYTLAGALLEGDERRLRELLVAAGGVSRRALAKGRR